MRIYSRSEARREIEAAARAALAQGALLTMKRSGPGMPRRFKILSPPGTNWDAWTQQRCPAWLGHSLTRPRENGDLKARAQPASDKNTRKWSFAIVEDSPV